MSAGDVMYDVSEQMIIRMMELRRSHSPWLITDRLMLRMLLKKAGVKLATLSCAEKC